MRFRLAALLLATLAGTAVAQPVPTAELDRLTARVASGGTVRVIAGVAVDAQPEGRLGRDAARRQRQAIRDVQNAAAAELGATGSRVKAVFDAVPHFAAEVDAAGLARLRASRHVRSVQEDLPVPPSLLQSTAQIRATTAWAAGRTGTGWAVAVLDTGVDKTHPFLAGKVVSEACYSTTSGSTSSSVCPGGVAASTAAGSGVHCNTAITGCTHGTHVAGIVAGVNAPDGSAGVARGADLIAIQVFSHFPSQGSVMSYTSDQIRGLERVLALKDTYRIAAVNMSLGGGQYTAPCDASQGAIKAAIDNLRSVGIATVIASGNDGYLGAISAPACISSAISVGASCDAGPDAGACATGVGGIASYSNIANFVSLVAPGSYITSSVPGGGYIAQNGTSMATPHVAGAWALVRQANPTASVDEVLSLLRANATVIRDTRAGGTATDLRSIDLGFVTGTAYAMTLTRDGTGSGSVSSSPSGIACGSDCSELWAEGTTVTLNPSASAGSSFGGWSGDCSGTGACTLTMSQARSVGATFTITPYTLTVGKSGTGSGRVTSSPAGIDCGSACSAAMNGGSTVVLTAAAAAGSRFTGWSGACTGTASTCSVAITAARSVGATFAAESYAVTVTKTGTGVGSVASTTTGINCGSACSVTRTYGSTMTLRATPTTGTAFAGWGGACSGTGDCTLTVTGPTAVSATFTRSAWPLAVKLAGTAGGSVASAPSGIDCGATCSAMMAVGASVTLSPTPAAGAYFTGWSGACAGTGPCTLTMNASLAATASFAPILHTLSVTRAGTGGGSVVSSPAGISCGSTCSKAFKQGTLLTLTAKPASGAVFAGWSGACSGTGTCSVTMAEAKTVEARFTQTVNTLRVTRTGTGSGTVTASGSGIACTRSCTTLMAADTPVTLTATAAAGSVFSGWSGACSGTDTSCTLPMSSAAAVGATFTRTHYGITVTRAGTGSGTVAAGPIGIDCGSSCSALAPVGSTQLLQATPAANSRFVGWSGACTGHGDCTLAMGTHRSVTAKFALLTHELGVTKSGSGTVASTPRGIGCGSGCSKSFTVDTTVTLKATPASGWRFTGWGGACSGTAGCSVTMDAAKAVTATFETP